LPVRGREGHDPPTPDALKMAPELEIRGCKARIIAGNHWHRPGPGFYPSGTRTGRCVSKVYAFSSFFMPGRSAAQGLLTLGVLWTGGEG